MNYWISYAEYHPSGPWSEEKTEIIDIFPPIWEKQKNQELKMEHYKDLKNSYFDLGAPSVHMHCWNRLTKEEWKEWIKDDT